MDVSNRKYLHDKIQSPSLDFYENFSSDLYPGSNCYVDDSNEQFYDDITEEALNNSLNMNGFGSILHSKHIEGDLELLEPYRNHSDELLIANDLHRGLKSSSIYISGYETMNDQEEIVSLKTDITELEESMSQVRLHSILGNRIDNEEYCSGMTGAKVKLQFMPISWRPRRPISSNQTILNMAEKEDEKEVLSLEYFRIKDDHQLQQKNIIASVHFKISLMSESFHKWRMHTISMNVKRRMKDVARVHYTDKVSTFYFKKWKNALREKCRQHQNVNMFIMARALKTWKRHTYLSSLASQQQHDLAVKHYNVSVVCKSFIGWRENHMMQKADECHQKHQMRKALKLWSLQLLKRKLQRRLARSHRIRKTQQKFFHLWRARKEDICHRRYLFEEKLKIFMLRCYWERWKNGVMEETIMRSSAASIDMLCKNNILKFYFSHWKHQFAIESFKTRHEEQDNNFILKMHFEKWMVRRKKILLLRKVESWNIIQGKLLLSQFFNQWKVEKKKREKKENEYEERLCIAHRIKTARYFHLWKRNCNDENIARFFHQVHQKKVLGRYFKLWKLMKRKVELLKLQDTAILSYTFLYWRQSAVEKIEKRRTKKERNTSTLRRCILHWKSYASLTKQKRINSVTCLARHWLDVTQQRNMQRRITQAEEASNEIIKKVHFAKWQHQYNTVNRRRLRMEEMADEHYECQLYSKIFKMWSRQLKITVLLRNHLLEKEKFLLASVFNSWHQVIQNDMLGLMNSFTEKLVLSDDSLQSDAVQKWRSPRVSSSLSKSHNSLINLYKDSLESSLQQNESLQLQSASQNKLILKSTEFGSTSSLVVIQKIEQSELCHSYPSLIFSPSELNECSSVALNPELFDYNTDNDVDQDQIFEDPYSELPLNFTPDTTVSEDHFVNSNQLSFMSSNIHIPRNDENLPTWIDVWKKRFMHSKILSKKKRFSHKDVITPRSNSLLLSMSGSFRNQDFELVKSNSCNLRQENLDQRKVALLVATLKYWKHLDISAAFYAWLEYTQRKKYQRLMLDYLVEKKRHYQLHTVFLRWNRKLYGARVNDYFRQKTLLTRYFDHWFKFHSFKQEKASRKQIAVNEHRKTLLKSCFDEWKRRCHLEFLLSGVNNSLDNDLDVLVEDFSVTRDKRTMERFFLSWKFSTLQMRLAKVHSVNHMQTRSIQLWRRFVLVKRCEKLKLKIYHRDHQLKKAFLTWKKKAQRQICFNYIIENKELKMKSLLLTKWLHWTKSRLDARSKENEFTSLCENRVVNKSFIKWKIEHTQRLLSTGHYNYVICSRWFTAWHDLANRRVEDEKKVKAFRHKCMQNMLSRAYACWKDAHDTMLQMRRDGNALSITFKMWKENVRHCKADRQYADTQVKHVFKSWKEKYVSRNELQFLAKISCRRWKSFMEKSRRNEKKIEESLEQRNLSIKRECFLKWRRTTQMLAISRSRSDGKILTKFFSAWKQVKEEQLILQQKTHQVQMIHMNNLISIHFRVWREHNDRIKALADIKWRLTMIMVKEKAVQWKLKTKEHILHSKSRNSTLKKYFQHWCRYCQQMNKAIHHDRRKKLTKTFKSWKMFREQQSSLKDIRERLLMMNIREKAIHWRLKTKESIFASKKNEDSLRMFFMIWKTYHQMRIRAIEFDDLKKLKSFMSTWVKFCQQRAEITLKVDKRIRWKNKELMLSVFQKWREYKTESIEAQKLDEAQCQLADDHYNQRLVNFSFCYWRKRTKVESVKKIRQRMLARQYFDRWRNNIVSAKYIVSIFREKRYEVYWRKWRDAFIQQRVLHVMEKREERRMMSVVFASWSRHSKLKRSLPNQMRKMETARWFQRWKNRCNS